MTEDNITVRKLKERFGDSIGEATYFRDEVTVIIDADRVVEICRFLRDDPDLQYNMLIDLTSIHWPGREKEFEVVYHLYSMPRNDRVRLKAPVDGKDPRIDSVCEVWKAANWLEREVYDLMGIKFRNHPDLRRIVLPEDWVGHPLRKDYPLRGYEREEEEREEPDTAF